jgi:DNA-binding SARP family transcriptional activator
MGVGWEAAGVPVRFGVLGPVTACDERGEPITLHGPRHRAVLARLLVARGRVVPVAMLVEDLWADPPVAAVGAIRTFVGDLRRGLEPERPPRSPARLLVTAGPGYALRPEPSTVDALRFEQAVESAATAAPGAAVDTLGAALACWRGPAYADFADEHWTRAECSRLTETRLRAVELRAAARLDLGLAAEAVPDLDAHTAEHPWREEGWRLLALALYRCGRQREALAVVRRAGGLLATHLGVDPGPALRQLESDILRQAAHLDPDTGPDAAAGRVWARASATYHRTVATTAQARLRSTVDLLRSLAVTGGSGLAAARGLRVATIEAAEELGDPDLTARVIGGYDVPAIWTRADDGPQAAAIVAAAERTLPALPPDAPDATRARLLATIAVESRGVPGPRGRAAAEQAELIARRLDDPALLVFALNGAFMQSFHRAGLAQRRGAIGAELVALSALHGLTTYEVLGHLIQLQARAAMGDLDAADGHAAAADRLAERYESPLVAVFTRWYRALRLALTDRPAAEVAAAYRSAATALDGAGMPGLSRGLLPLALLSLRLREHRPAPTEDGIDWGPYEPWVRPHLLLARGDRPGAALALRGVPQPPPDHMLEALWSLTAHAALALDDAAALRRAHAALAPAAAEHAGAGTGLLTFGPVAEFLR